MTTKLSAFLLPPLLLGAAGRGDLPRGVLIDKLTTTADPSQAYALDARGRALIPAEGFRAAAERHGYVVASSYNSASDGPVTVTVEAMRAMWNDTHARLSLDDRRAYLAGFSGTARTACFLAGVAPGSVAGVIGTGAGFPSDAPPTREAPFAFFGTVGNRDFNYSEMVDLDETLDQLGWRHRIEVFSGGHEWPPEEVAGAALLWMEVHAMRDGRRERSDEIIGELWQRDQGRAREAEASGRLFEAHRRLACLARDLNGLRDVSEATREATRIAGSPGYVEESKARMARQRRDQAALQRARDVLAATDPAEPSSFRRAVADLGLGELKGRWEKAPDSDDGLSAVRTLNTLVVQTGFYLPRACTERGEHARAAFLLSIAAEIRPDSAEIWFDLAAAHARSGQRPQALEALRRAVREGFSDADRLDREPAFDTLRKTPAFEGILAGLRAPRAKAPETKSGLSPEPGFAEVFGRR